jgi:hypothetical protein
MDAECSIPTGVPAAWERRPPPAVRLSPPFSGHHNWDWASPTNATTFTTESQQALEMTGVASHTQDKSAGPPICTAAGCPEGVRHRDVPHAPIFKAATFEIFLELPADMVGQEFSLFTQLVDKGGVVLFNELIKKSLFWSVTLIFGTARGILA